MNRIYLVVLLFFTAAAFSRQAGKTEPQHTAETAASISFKDVTKNYKAEGYSDSGYGHGISFADVDKDGRIDLFASNAIREQELPDMLFVNQGSWFSEQAAGRGTADPGLTHSIVSFDADNDGDLDVFFANMSIYPDKSDGFGRNALYQNNGRGYYSNISNQGISNDMNDTRGAIALDINNDGWLDIYAVNWGQENEMYLNLGNGRYKRVNRGANGPDGDTSAQQGVTAADFDNDGDIDIYVSRRDADNWLLVNDGNGYFTNKANELGVDVGGRSNGAVFADIDNDADLDLFVINSSLSGGGLPLLGVYINNGDGTFENKSDKYGIRTSAYSVAFGDVDNDADLDLFLLYNNEKDPGAVPRLFLNDGHGNFEKITCGVEVPAQDARAVSYGDIDADGDIDFYLTAKFGRNYLLRNDLNSTNHYIDILCFGPGGDYGGFGSKVVVYEPGFLGSPNHILGYQESVSNYAYLCQNQTALHFGLKDNAECDIRIIRTDGQIFDFRRVAADQLFSMNDRDPEEYGLYYVSGDNQSGFVSEPLADPFVVRVHDQYGRTIPNADVTFAPQNGGQILGSQPILTNANGLAAAHFVLGDDPKRYEITATSSYTDDVQVVFHAEAREQVVHISKNYGDAQVGTVGQNLASPVVVQARYENSRPAPDIDISFWLQPNNGSINGNTFYTTQTDASGKARAVWTLGETAGTQILFAGYKDEILQFSATAIADVAARIAADSLDSANFDAGKTYPVSCRIYDQYDNPVNDGNVFFSIISGYGSLAGEQSLVTPSGADGRAAVEWSLGRNHTYQNTLRASIETDSVFWTIHSVRPPLLTHSTISARDSIAANGIDSTRIAIQLLNEEYVPLPDYAVDVHVSGTQNELQTFMPTSDELGFFYIELKSRQAEVKRIGAKVPGVGVVPDTLELLFYKPEPQGVHLEKVTGDDQIVPAGQSLTRPLSVRVVDNNKNPVPDHDVLFYISNEQAHFDGADSVVLQSDARGCVEVIPTIEPLIKHDHIRVVAATAIDSQRVYFDIYLIPDDPASLSRLTPDSLQVNARDSVHIAVRSRDQFGNNTPRIHINFSSDASDTFFPNVSVTDSMGIAHVTVQTGRPSGRHTVTAAVNEQIKTTFIINVLPVDTLVRLSPDSIFVKDENDAAVLRAQCLDGFKAPISGVLVRFSCEQGDGEFVESPQQQSDAKGVVETLWRPFEHSAAAIIRAASPHDTLDFIVIRDIVSKMDHPLPTHFALGDNFPNPFNPTTRIPFCVPHTAHVLVDIYNLQGRRVRRLLNAPMQAGEHVITFQARDDAGHNLPSGVYVYRMTADEFDARKRLLLLK